MAFLAYRELASAPVLPEKVIVKIPRLHPCPNGTWEVDKESVQSLRDEDRFAEQLRGLPHVAAPAKLLSLPVTGVALRDGALLGKLPVLLVPLRAGGYTEGVPIDLGKVLPRRQVAAQAERTNWHRLARALATAVQALHAVGVVHLDLKPGNVVLLEHEGRWRNFDVIDFGIAARDASKRLGRKRLGRGSLSYMLPSRIEDLQLHAVWPQVQIGGRAPLRPTTRRQSDLHALAVTLLEAWYGAGVVYQLKREARLAPSWVRTDADKRFGPTLRYMAPWVQGLAERAGIRYPERVGKLGRALAYAKGWQAIGEDSRSPEVQLVMRHVFDPPESAGPERLPHFLSELEALSTRQERATPRRLSRHLTSMRYLAEDADKHEACRRYYDSAAGGAEGIPAAVDALRDGHGMRALSMLKAALDGVATAKSPGEYDVGALRRAIRLYFGVLAPRQGGVAMRQEATELWRKLVTRPGLPEELRQWLRVVGAKLVHHLGETVKPEWRDGVRAGDEQRPDRLERWAVTVEALETWRRVPPDDIADYERLVSRMRAAAVRSDADHEAAFMFVALARLLTKAPEPDLAPVVEAFARAATAAAGRLGRVRPIPPFEYALALRAAAQETVASVDWPGDKGATADDLGAAELCARHAADLYLALHAPQQARESVELAARAIEGRRSPSSVLEALRLRGLARSFRWLHDDDPSVELDSAGSEACARWRVLAHARSPHAAADPGVHVAVSYVHAHARRLQDGGGHPGLAIETVCAAGQPQRNGAFRALLGHLGWTRLLDAGIVCTDDHPLIRTTVQGGLAPSDPGGTLANLAPQSLVGAKFLDVGCGLGLDLELACGLGFDVVGVEASPWLVERTRDRLARSLGIENDPHLLEGRGVRVVYGEVGAAGFDLPAGAFHVALIRDALGFAVDRLPVLEAAAAALRPGGLLLLTEWVLRSPPQPQEPLRVSEYLAFLRQTGYTSLPTEASLCAMIERAGFELLERLNYDKEMSAFFGARDDALSDDADGDVRDTLRRAGDLVDRGLLGWQFLVARRR